MADPPHAYLLYDPDRVRDLAVELQKGFTGGVCRCAAHSDPRLRRHRNVPRSGTEPELAQGLLRRAARPHPVRLAGGRFGWALARQRPDAHMRGRRDLGWVDL